MKEEEIIEGNRLIAKFLGYQFKIDDNFKYPYFIVHGNVFFENELSYHRSWDILMPVVEKIAETRRYAIIDEVPEDEWWVYVNLIYLKITTSILSVWQAVVEYIKWYNENETRKNNS